METAEPDWRRSGATGDPQLRFLAAHDASENSLVRISQQHTLYTQPR